MANLGRESTNNNGVQDALLRAVKPSVDTTVLKSDLAAGKEKALADDIIAKLSEKLNLSQEALGEYLQKLTSKSIDATLARVVNVVKRQGNAEFSESQIEGIRELLAEAAAAKEQPQSPKALTLAQLQEFFAARDKEKQEGEQKASESEAEKPTAPEAAAPSPEPEEQSEEEPEAAPAPAVDVAKVQAYIQMQFDKLFETENQIVESTTAALQLAQAAAESPISKIDTQMSGIGDSISQMSQRLEQLELFEPPAIDIPAPVVSIPEVNVLPPPVIVNQDAAPAPEASEDLGLQAALQDSTAMIMSQIDTQTSQLGSMLVDSNSMLQQVLLSPIQSIGLAVGAVGEAVNVVLVAPFKALSSKISSIAGTVGNLVTAPFKLIGNKISGVVDSVTGFVGGMFKSVSDKIASFGTALKDGFKDVLAGVGSALASVALAPLKAIGGLFAKLNPFKRKKKRKSAEELKLAQMIDKVNDFIDHFFDRMLEHVDAFLDRVLKSAKKIVTKLMTHIFTWILVNVGLLGAILALVIPMIAEPLMKIIQPILDFIAPIRDFLINTLTKVIDNVIIPLGEFVLKALKSIFELVLEPFLRGIGTVAEALGTALGKLIIGIADFFVDTLLPFLRDHLVPILSSILDCIKELFDAIKPWIKPIVDTVMPILVSVLDTVRQLFELLKPVIVELGKFLAGVFMDVIKAVGWTYDNVVKPIAGAISKFIKIVMNIGKFLMDKLLEGLSHLPIVGKYFKPSGASEEPGEISSLEEAKAEIARLQGKIDQLTSSTELGKLTAEVEEKSKRLVEVEAGTLLSTLDKVTELFNLVKDQVIGKLNTLLSSSGTEEAAAPIPAPIAESTEEVQHAAEVSAEMQDFGHELLDIALDCMLKVGEVLHSKEVEIQDMLSVMHDATMQFLEPLAEMMDQADAQLAEVEEQDIAVPSVSSENVVALQSASSNETADQVEAVSQEATANAAVTATADKKKDKALMQFLSKMSAAMDNNFNAILEKLDSKPDLMPMPILTPTNANNLASMENLF